MEQLTRSDAMPLDGEATIKKLWDEAATEFEKICGESLRGGDIKSFEDVQKVIESKHQAGTYDEAEQTGWAQAKEVGLESLKYITVLATITASASTFIPIPSAAANMANTALTFVLGIPKAVKDYTDAVNEVFNEVSSALAQVRIYGAMESIDPSLSQQIHRVMISFVKLSAHVVKYRQDGKKSRFLHKMKAGLLRNDSGLEAEMTEFKRVLQQQRDVEGTVTLKVALHTDAGVALLNKKFGAFQKEVEITQQKVQTIFNNGERLKQLDQIKSTFGLLHESRTSAICTEHNLKCLPGTGDWIWEHDAYTEWTTSRKANGSPSHALFLSGPPSSGKTLACARITKQLEGTREDRTYVAHYFFPKNQNIDEVPYPAQLALKYMAFQIAGADPTVQDALYKACQADNEAFRVLPGPGKLSRLWDKLKIGVSGSGKKYYLVFDGLENLPSEQATELVDFILDLGLQVTGEAKAAGQFRVLASGVHEKFEVVRASTALRIDMVKSNIPDLKVFIEHKLAEKGMLRQPKPNSDQEKAKKKILERLPQKVEGSYSNLLSRIGTGGDVIQLLSSRKASIEDLDRTLEDDISNGQAAIRIRQQLLTVDEINDLNELLKWVLFCKYSLTLTQLEAALYLHSNSEALGMTLETVINDKYASILKIEAGDVYVEDLVSDFLTKTDDSAGKPVRREDQALISMSITIKNVDPETCGNFLWDLAHKSNRQKFNFGFDANDPNHSGQAPIAVDELEAHYTIILTTFKYLEQEKSDHTQDLGTYLIAWLPHHLACLRLAMDKPNRFLLHRELQEIGLGLYKLFRDNVLFERHKTTFNETYWSVEEMENVQEWLADSSVMGKIADKPERERLKQRSPAKGYMRDFTNITVRSLLRERDSNFGRAFVWLQKLMLADERLRVPGAPSSPQSDETSTSSTPLTNKSDWNRISDWCQDILKMSDPELDSLWYERLALLASTQDDPPDMDTILSLYNRALEKDKPSWQCFRGLGEAHYQRDDIPNAMKHIKLALIEAETEGATPKPSDREVFDLQLLLAQYATKLGDIEVAKDWYLKACHSKNHDQAQEAQVGLLKATFDFPDQQETSKWLQERLNEEGGEKRLVGILKKAARDVDHENVISRLLVVAHEDPDLWGVVKRAMETASATLAPGEEDPSDKTAHENDPENDHRELQDESIGVLLYYQGIAEYQFGAPSDTNNLDTEALKFWEASRDQLCNIRSYNAYNVRQNATKWIARHHFQALVHQDDPPAIYIDALTQLAEAESKESVYNWCATAFLGSLYAIRKEADLSRARLVQGVKLGLQILSDDTPENDQVGFYFVLRALVSHDDLPNAAIALLLYQARDPVATRLSSFKVEDVLESDGMEKQRVLEVVNEMASKTLDVLESQSSGTRKRTSIELATTHVESCLARLESMHGVDNLDETDRRLKTAAYNSIIARLRTPQQETNYDMRWAFYCDGRSIDGKKCVNDAFYHCVYCPNIDFCVGCLERLRSSNESCNRDITACNSKHQWLKVPPHSSKLYVGPAATLLQVPRISCRDEIHEILEGEGKSISVEDWKSALARTWGITLGEEGN